MKNLLVPMSLVLLCGCVNGIPTISTTTNAITENTEMVMFGVPILAGISASAARLDENWMVTAAHADTIIKLTGKEVFYHPTCDIALYRSKGTNTVPLGTLKLNDTVTHLGYYAGLLLVANEGKFVSTITKVESPNCKADVVTTASAGGGMSGGGVYNSKGELVGITDAMYHETMVIQGNPEMKEVVAPTSFISLSDVAPWLTEVTGKEYY